jgi:RimJ/RimL family protein N-acetyltransferase
MADTSIATERLVLSRLLPADAPRMFAYRADLEVSRFQSWLPASLEEVQRFIDGLQSVSFDTPGTWYQFGIRLKDSGLLVGDAGVHFPADEPRQAEIGITVTPDHQGLGIGTEAVRGLLNRLFTPPAKHRVFGSVDPRNQASVALLARVGMRQEAHFRQSLWLRGEWVDDLVFAILESEWTAQPGLRMASRARVRDGGTTD